ncbi:MAG: hypothetical protein ACRBBP_06330 [Bdellovibrionales bacterium]
MTGPSIIRAVLTVFSVFLSLGCGSVKYSSVASGILNRTWTVDQASPDEKAYCADSIFHTPSHLISGQASFEYRPISVELGEEGLRDIAEDTRPIRHAQYDVTDASGTILQCGETDGDGNFSFSVPQNNRALSINIYTRSNNSFNRASVFIAPETNELHKIQYFFTANKSASNIEIVAEGDGSLIGGAFNILDQIHNSFDSLAVHTSPGEGINPLDIPKVDIYWEKGFNPGVYVDVNSGLSFFSKPQMKLFILGGSNGDVDYADTDHFDNSIILHEYFHFLESAISISHSPGGTHSGNELLDPRLAWSEGAAQFYQAFVTNTPTVLDTRGNTDGSTGFYLKLSVENETTDQPIEEGEGEFREFAVARLLWDIHDIEDAEEAPENFDNVNGFFSNFWRAFSGTSLTPSFNHDKAYFASSSLLLDAINQDSPIQGNADWNELLLHSFMTQPIHTPVNSFRAQYGQNIVPGTTATFSFTGPFFLEDPYLPNNHPVASIDYYSLHVPSGVTQSISVTSTTVDGTGGAVQLYVFDSNYTNLTEFIHGPLEEGVPVNLDGEPGTGTVYLIAVVVSDLPIKTVSSVEATLNYSFPGYNIGGF